MASRMRGSCQTPARMINWVVNAGMTRRRYDTKVATNRYCSASNQLQPVAGAEQLTSRADGTYWLLSPLMTWTLHMNSRTCVALQRHTHNTLRPLSPLNAMRKQDKKNRKAQKHNIKGGYGVSHEASLERVLRTPIVMLCWLSALYIIVSLNRQPYIMQYTWLVVMATGFLQVEYIPDRKARWRSLCICHLQLF
jgi:hypothetical protein